MSLLLESICVHRKRFERLELHQTRMNRSRRDLLGLHDELLLTQELTVPGNLGSGIYKCRVEYDRNIDRVEFVAYEARLIASLQIVTDDAIEYPYKLTDRSCFERHLKSCGADDLLIVKNGLVTDTSYSNVAFLSGGEWVTPAQPLLQGTRRESLLACGMLREADIRVRDISNYQCIALLNAMLCFSPTCMLDTKQIIR
jgi:4-amino-4-deoxychorismate lyase